MKKFDLDKAKYLQITVSDIHRDVRNLQEVLGYYNSALPMFPGNWSQKRRLNKETKRLEAYLKDFVVLTEGSGFCGW